MSSPPKKRILTIGRVWTPDRRKSGCAGQIEFRIDVTGRTRNTPVRTAPGTTSHADNFTSHAPSKPHSTNC